MCCIVVPATPFLGKSVPFYQELLTLDGKNADSLILQMSGTNSPTRHSGKRRAVPFAHPHVARAKRLQFKGKFASKNFTVLLP